jgi:hypothetical protein
MPGILTDPIGDAVHAVVKAIRDSWLENSWDVSPEWPPEMRDVFRKVVGNALAQPLEDSARLEWIAAHGARIGSGRGRWWVIRRNGVDYGPVSEATDWRAAVDLARQETNARPVVTDQG